VTKQAQIACAVALALTVVGTVGGETLAGRFVVDRKGYETHRFVKSYLYVFELNEYLEVEPDGSFMIEALPAGTYSFKTFVPGFDPSYRTIEFPAETVLEMKIGLQVIDIGLEIVEREVPRYLEPVRDLLTTPEARETHIQPVPAPTLPPSGEAEPPSINLIKVFDSIRNLFRRDRDRDE
jgi:hypothetical protein